MKQITVIGLGPGGAEQLTREACVCLESGEQIVFRTSRHPVASHLQENGVFFTSLDEFHDRYEDFDAMYEAMARELWKKASPSLVFCVPDLSTDTAVLWLRRLKPARASLKLIPGVSIASDCIARLGGVFDASSGVSVIPASGVTLEVLMCSAPLLITEIDNPLLAGAVKLLLSQAIGDETPVTFLPSSLGTSGKPKKIPACEIDRQHVYDHTVSVYVPPLGLQEKTRYGFSDLRRLVEILRRPDGCPWDSVQTHQSMRPRLIEEAYEAADAIDQEDDEHLSDELGDILFQVFFHSSIGEQHGSFDLSDVTTAICRKMIGRHPMLFSPPDGTPESQESWEERKKAEKGFTVQADLLWDVPHALPALIRASKVQKKAADVGFDWNTPEDALPKVFEEAQEVREALSNGTGLEEELGDLLFSCVNVSRLSGIDPERALTIATDKFVRRFSEMEKLIISDGKSLKHLTLQEMDVYWNRVK